jgi:PAS domain S-box-containing protein
MLKDVSERKKVEEALSRSERQYRSVVDNIGIGVSMIGPDMEILALNKQMDKWFPNVEVSKKPVCYETFNNPPGNNVCSYCPTCKTLQDGQVHESITETPMNGKIVNFRVISSPIKDKDGKVVAAIEMVDDITKHKRLEDELKQYSERLEQLVEERTRKLSESEKELRGLFENVPDGIYRSSSDGKILSANPALVQMLGYGSLDELIQVDISRDLYVNMDERESWKGELEQKGEIRNAEIVLKHKTGQRIVVLENAHVVRDEDGKILCFEGTLTDITERKMLEERLSALNLYGEKLNVAKNLDEIYEVTLDAMEKTLGFDHASFLTLRKGRICFDHQRGYFTPTDFELPLDGSKGGVTVKVAVTGKTLLLPDVSKDKDYVCARQPLGKAELAVPVIVEGQVAGVLNVESEHLGAFDEKDMMLLEILASHAAAAISNTRRRYELERRNAQQISLMKSSAEMIHSIDLRTRLKAILDAISGLGWRRVVLSVRQQNLDIGRPQDIVSAGLTKKEEEYLWENRQPGTAWQERVGPDFERFKLGEFYYLPWSDPWVRQRFSQGTVSSHLKPEEMVDWNPDDLLYAPLRLADGRIVGVVSIDDPVGGRRPTQESLMPFELFLHQAAVAIENARLIEQLDSAKAEVQEYAKELEAKVEERTKELVEAQARLLKSERLAAIGELAGMIGHDLRNPLTGIAGAAYYLKSKHAKKLDARSGEMLQIIERSIGYSNKIINDLLEYSKEIKLDLIETNPKMIMRETMFHLKVPRNVKVIDKTRSKPKFMVDKEKMLRVFTNLIRNAVDAMPKGGTVIVRNESAGDKVFFSFIDNGAGMSKKTLDKLWTPLFTTKAKGMGFGLPICKRFVEGHGGKISAESEEGNGSTLP